MGRTGPQQAPIDVVSASRGEVAYSPQRERDRTRTLRFWARDGQILDALANHDDLVLPDGQVCPWARSAAWTLEMLGRPVTVAAVRAQRTRDINRHLGTEDR